MIIPLTFLSLSEKIHIKVHYMTKTKKDAIIKNKKKELGNYFLLQDFIGLRQESRTRDEEPIPATLRVPFLFLFFPWRMGIIAKPVTNIYIFFKIKIKNVTIIV